MLRLPPHVCLSVLMLTACARAGKSPPPAGPHDVDGLRVDSAALDSIVRLAHDRSRFAGLSVAVARDSTVLWTDAVGEADVERHVPARPETVYGLMSISKQLTAAAVLRLVEGGRLALDDRVARYLAPAWPETSRVTIRQLLSHTAGIANHTDLPGWDSLSTRTLQPEDELALSLAAPRLYPPGARWHYANTGFVALGLLVERASRRRYEDFVRDELLAPAGMRDTRLCADREADSARAAGYVRRAGRLVPWEPERWSNIRAAGGWCTTVRDLVRWEAALDSGRVLAAASLRAMRTPTPMGIGLTVDYGLGTRLGALDGRPVVGHTGGGQGFSTALLYFPRERLTIAVLMNTERGIDGVTARIIAGRLARRQLSMPMPMVRELPVPEEEIRADTGVWLGDYGTTLILARKDRLYWQPAGVAGDAEPMPYQGKHTFSTGEDVLVRFARARDGTGAALIYAGGLFESAAYRQ